MDTDSDVTDGRIELPDDFAEHAAPLGGLDAPPATLGEWWTALSEQFPESDVSVGLSDLYSESPTRHEVLVNDRVRCAHCALDALAAAVMEEQDTTTVRSIDPVTGTPVTFVVSENGVVVSPEEALICFGSTLDAGAVEAAGSLAAWSVQDDESEVREGVCQYTSVFESEATYEQWAGETESVTASLPPTNVVALLREFPGKRS